MGNIVQKNHSDHAIEFDGAFIIPFENVASVTASHALSTIVGVLPLGQDIKVVKVTANVTAISGAPAIQLVNGPGSSIGAVPVPTGTNVVDASPAVLNVGVFSAPVSLTNAANIPQTAFPGNIDVVYAGSHDAVGGNNMLTLRYLTGGGDTASNLKVSIVCKALDLNPTAEPYSPTTS